MFPKHWIIDSRHLAIGREYEKLSSHARELNTKQSAKDHKSLDEAHTLLISVIASITELHEGKAVPEKFEGKKRLTLTAAFIQGIGLCKESILNSLYVQAGTLLRQEFECLCLLNEIANAQQRDLKQDNARYVLCDGTPRYGELSELAHLSDRTLLESVMQHATDWGDYSSAVPQYHPKTTDRLFGLHITLVLDFIHELKTLYSDVWEFHFSDDDLAILGHVEGILTANNNIVKDASG